jgi:hypothetical protein
MGELINGRTPEEIKRVLEWANCACGSLVCEECQYYESVCSHENFERIAPDALALIEHLEAQQPKWISVKEQLPEEVCRCLVITKRHEESSMVNTATYNHMGWWTHGNFGEITHWMPLPQPPEEDE